MRILKILPLILSLLIISAALFFFYPSKKTIQKLTQTNRNYEKEKKIHKLESPYIIKYGDKSSTINIVEYFSFQCPHCIRLFKEQFNQIKAEFIDTNKAYFEFHPVPNDLLTVQALICLSNLNEEEKRLFLEVILEEADPTDDALMAKLMMAAMNVFKKPIPSLEDENFLKNHEIMKISHDFILQQRIEAVPTIEVNGILYAKEIPNYQFIKTLVEE